MTPRSASRNATGLPRIGLPRSACTVSSPADLLLLGRLLDQRLGELAALAVLHRPADRVAAEHVEDHVQVEARPLRRALELRDVPRPQLVRPLGEQLRLRVAGMGELVAPLAHPAVAAAASSRYIVRSEARYRPSSSSVAHTCAGEQSTNRSECSSASTASRSASDSARAGAGRGRGGLGSGGRRRR